MTEKQYKVGYFDDPNPVDSYVECDGEYLNASDVVGILKELQEENKQLKKENYHLRCTIESNSQDDYIDYLKKQNEQLKQELKIYRKVANCRNCDFQDYDCNEDGDVFEICDKGKDMKNGICEDWREFE